MVVDSSVGVLDPNLSGTWRAGKLRRVTIPLLFHYGETSVTKQSKRPRLFSSRKFVWAEYSAKHAARCEADDCLRRISPAVFKNVIEGRRTKFMDLAPFQCCNRLLNVLVRDLRPEILDHRFPLHI
jgi:hypothetical protein